MGFDWNKAQKYEWYCTKAHLDTNFVSLRDSYLSRNSLGCPGGFFEEPEWQTVVLPYISGKTCMEVGCASSAFLSPGNDLKKRIIIDPQLNLIRQRARELCGDKTWLHDKMTYYSQPAEIFIHELTGQVDGLIMIRNCLDHCEKPYIILENLGRYAAEGCWLALWNDIWHINPPADEGHRDITKNPKEFEDKIIASGFKVIRHVKQRDDGTTIEYGCVARKCSQEKIS